MVTSVARAQHKGGEWEVQITEYKVGSVIYCTTWGIHPIFCKNCKWSETFKNCIKKTPQSGVKQTKK